jgi:hypoxanthine phosphoribosyltransferase
MSERKLPENHEILLETDAILERVRQLGEEISAYYAEQPPLLVGVLNGAVIFMADLARAMRIPVTFEFMAVSSYGDEKQSSGTVRILKDLDTDIAGRRVLIVEDIIDSGVTLDYLLRILDERRPADVRVVSLLRKPAAKKRGTQSDWIGFDVDDVFVVGYGLDYAGRFRNLPYIAALRED